MNAGKHTVLDREGDGFYPFRQRTRSEKISITYIIQGQGATALVLLHVADDHIVFKSKMNRMFNSAGNFMSN